MCEVIVLNTYELLEAISSERKANDTNYMLGMVTVEDWKRKHYKINHVLEEFFELKQADMLQTLSKVDVYLAIWE